MVEGGKIDWACHANDAATVFNEVKDIDEYLCAVEDTDEFFENLIEYEKMRSEKGYFMETSLAEGALYVVGFESDMGKNELPNELFFDDESQPVRKTLEAIGEEVKKEQPYYSERVNLLLRDLLLQTMRKCAPKAKKTDEKLDMLINYIHAYCTMEIDFKALANSLNYSYDYLRHYFKAQKKMSLKQYVTQRRIALAKEYLASDMPIADVAGKCGFYSPAYFSAVFRQYTGITPTQYHDACCHIHNWNDMILCDPTAHSGRESLE